MRGAKGGEGRKGNVIYGERRGVMKEILKSLTFVIFVMSCAVWCGVV